MNKYMLLLHDPVNSGGEISAEEMQQIIGDYVDWRNKIESDGRLIGGEKLADEGGKHLRNSGGEIRVTDGPFTEVKEALGGYFAVKAENYEEAVEISKSCPHLKYGGWIELREIDDTH
ncbi:MAG: transcription initiation protein [Acidobacteria bacterium]|nr:transcription initiation protein [Acidobacteriota bacterium]